MTDDIVGIDLGTTNSLIGVMEAGFPILLADANGERLTPSVVHFPEAGEPLVGAAASACARLNRERRSIPSSASSVCAAMIYCPKNCRRITRSLGRRASRCAFGCATGNMRPRKSRR